MSKADAMRLARWGAGRVWTLWLLVCALCAATTVFFSLDTTAVLVTPAVVALTRHTGLRALPFAVTTIWLANTASSLLPVSNLTNLLAQQASGYSALEPSALGHPVRMMALLIGTNCGPLITPWASLATPLWHDRLTAMGVRVPWGRYVILGAIAAPMTVIGSVAALALVG